MQRIKVQAIVLKPVDIGEADRIVHLLTPELGRQSAMAKSARKSVKRFPGTLDLLNHLDVELHRRPGRMAYVSKAALLSPFLGLREHPMRFALGCYLVEFLGRLAPEGGAPDDARQLFDFTLSALRAIETGEPDTKLRVFLELHALRALGLRPQLVWCVRCGEELQGGAQLGFHVGDGGALCGSCLRGQEGVLSVHLGTLRALEQGLRFELGALDRLRLGARELAEAELVVGRFHRFHVGIELRSEAFLRETQAGVARSRGEGNTPPP